MKRFNNKVAVITGGAAGIGRAAVEKFAREGAAVSIWDVSEAKGKDLEALLLKEGLKVKFQKVDTTKYV